MTRLWQGECMTLQRADSPPATWGGRTISALQDLYEESFPEAERIPFQQLLDWLNDGRLQLWLSVDESCFAITQYLDTPEGDVLLEYLAVRADCRSEGRGTDALRALTSQIAGPIVLEVEDPEVSVDRFAARRIDFYERFGARRIYEAEGYAMPDLATGGLLPMHLLDLVPSRRERSWTRTTVRTLILAIWTGGYGVDPTDARLVSLIAKT